MTDRFGPKLIGDTPSSSWRFQPGTLRSVSGNLCQVLDLLLLGATFMVVVALPGMIPGHLSPGDVLRMGLSLRIAFVATMCLCTWRVLLLSVGIYVPILSRTRPNYIFRCLIGLNSCTAVIGMILLVMRTRIEVWRFMGIYWLIAFAVLSLMRVALIGLYQRTSGSRLE